MVAGQRVYRRTIQNSNAGAWSGGLVDGAAEPDRGPGDEGRGTGRSGAWRGLRPGLRLRPGGQKAMPGGGGGVRSGQWLRAREAAARRLAAGDTAEHGGRWTASMAATGTGKAAKLQSCKRGVRGFVGPRQRRQGSLIGTRMATATAAGLGRDIFRCRALGMAGSGVVLRASHDPSPRQARTQRHSDPKRAG